MKVDPTFERDSESKFNLFHLLSILSIQYMTGPQMLLLYACYMLTLLTGECADTENVDLVYMVRMSQTCLKLCAAFKKCHVKTY